MPSFVLPAQLPRARTHDLTAFHHDTAQRSSNCDTYTTNAARAAFKNLWRGALLTVMATFLGPFLFFTVPDFLVNTITRSPMPLWFYQSEVRACGRTA